VELHTDEEVDIDRGMDQGRTKLEGVRVSLRVYKRNWDRIQ